MVKILSEQTNCALMKVLTVCHAHTLCRSDGSASQEVYTIKTFVGMNFFFGSSFVKRLR